MKREMFLLEQSCCRTEVWLGTVSSGVVLSSMALKKYRLRVWTGTTSFWLSIGPSGALLDSIDLYKTGMSVVCHLDPCGS